MALQPASGAKDLNPKQVEINHLLIKQLENVYRLWGYEEVSPPRVERLATLTAAGAIGNEDIVKIVADEALGLRPEMTASITRAACTRLADRPRPLRLCATGTIFESRDSVEGGLFIEEQLQCGVELFGVKDISAEIELLSLLLDSMEKLGLDKKHEPTILIGHTSLMELILLNIEGETRESVRNSLLNYDRVTLEKIKLDKRIKERILFLQSCRGYPSKILSILDGELGNSECLDNLKRLFKIIEPIASRYKIGLQLDPTFQPHFELYTGITFQLVCKGKSAPDVIARGGRYDELVRHFGARESNAAGLGFSFAIDKIRELVNDKYDDQLYQSKILITYSENTNIENALLRQSHWHKQGKVAQVELKPFINKSEALLYSQERGYSDFEWLE